MLILFFLTSIFLLLFSYFYLRKKCNCSDCGNCVGSGSGGSGCFFEYKKNNLNKESILSNSFTEYNKEKIKLLRTPSDNIIGKGFHRSGWPYVIKKLNEISSENGILLDDFVEQNFCYSKGFFYENDWIGIFHHPPFPPDFSNNEEKMINYLKTPEFKESSKRLKLAIVLSKYHQEELKKHLNCPVVYIPHPIEGKFKEWSIENWNSNRFKSIVQVGVYLRNTQLIDQVPNIKNIKKIRLWSNMDWVNSYDKLVKKFWSTKSRKSFSNFEDVLFLPPSSFDEMLSKNVVVMEMFDASASNGVLDCIIRNTPIIINRHKAVEEYLGKDYPLYFESPEEIPFLLNKIEDANIYLKNMDKTKLTSQYFISELLKACKKNI